MINIFDGLELPLSEENVRDIFSSGNIRIERILSSGQTTDWQNNDENEFVALISGSAVIEYDDGNSVSLNKGDTLFIEHNTVHRVSYTSCEPKCVWICFFWK